MSLFIGSGVAIITPFNENGDINLNKLEELLNWHVKNNTDAIIICGTTGEGSTLTDNEKKRLIQTTIEIINKKIPVIAGVGTNNTQKLLNFLNFQKKLELMDY